MQNFLIFLLNCFKSLANVLSFKPFPDMNITYLQLILGAIIIPFIIKLLYGAFYEAEARTNFDYFNNVKKIGRSSKDISNSSRKNQLNGYKPKHAGESRAEYQPKHESKFNGYKPKHASKG